MPLPIFVVGQRMAEPGMKLVPSISQSETPFPILLPVRST